MYTHYPTKHHDLKTRAICTCVLYDAPNEGKTIFLLILVFINQFMMNGISQSYKLDESIFILWVVEWYLHFYLNVNGTFWKQTVESSLFVNVPQKGGLAYVG